MIKPVDGPMDCRAAYVALTRATALEALFLIGPVVLEQLRQKPNIDIAATLDFLMRLDEKTLSAFLEQPTKFSPVTVTSIAATDDDDTEDDDDSDLEDDNSASFSENDDDTDNGSDNDRTGYSGSGAPASGNTGSTPLAIYLAPNSQSNCFYNAAVASTLAAFDGQSLPSAGSSTPAAKVFFSAIRSVRDYMYNGALPPVVLVRTL